MAEELPDGRSIDDLGVWTKFTWAGEIVGKFDLIKALGR